MSKKRNQDQKAEPFTFNFSGPEAAGGESNANLVQALQSGLSSLIGRDSGLMDTLPEPMKRRIYGLKHLHSQYLDLETQYKQELRVLEEKYEKLYEPIFDKRATIVQGQVEPTEEEIESGRPKEDEEKDENEETEKTAESKGAVINADHGFPEDAKGIPHFWLGVLGNAELIQRMITERDEKLLQHLIDIKIRNMEPVPSNGFVLEFHFSENEFMNDTVLRKSYFLEEDEGELIFNHAEGTAINWKPQQNLTVQRVTKNAGGGKRGRGGRGKRGGRGAQQKVVVEEPCESFFNFFSPPKVPEEEEEIDEEMLLELRSEIEDDFDTGCFIKDRLIKNAVNWYTGEAMEDDDYDFDDDEEGEEGDDDEEDDDDDDAPREAPRQVKDAGEQPPECKQQ